MISYYVDDLQACEPDELTKVDGITVELDPELDSMGFNRVRVEGPTREAVLDYVRANWGDDETTGGWFTEWVADRVTAYEVTDLQRAIALGKQEILADVAAGRVPRTVASFAELHDYVDANEYGGLCEEFSHYLDEGDLDFGNRLQGTLDEWIKDGGVA